MSIIYIPIAVILWLIAAMIFVRCFLNYVALVETLKKTSGKSLAKERYFLYDSKDAKWVETTKDPTGGKHGK